MVRGKGTTIAAKPGTVEFQKEAYQASTRVPLSPSEFKELEEEKDALESSIKEAQEASGSSRAGGIDVNRAKARISQIDHAIEQRMPEKLKGNQKDSLYREEREIEDRLIVGMPTRYEMEHPHKCPGAVRKHMAWDSRNKGLINRYVEIQRVLRPDEPKSIEELRSEGGPRK